MADRSTILPAQVHLPIKQGSSLSSLSHEIPVDRWEAVGRSITIVILGKKEMRKRNQLKRLLVATLVIAPLVVIATNYNMPYCDACGNTTSTRSYQTVGALANFADAMRANSGIQVSDTVTVSGGDGSHGVYKRNSLSASIQWQCVDACGPGDNAEWFVAPYSPTTGSSGSGGSGTGGSGSGGGGFGPFGPPGGDWQFTCTVNGVSCDKV